MTDEHMPPYVPPKLTEKEQAFLSAMSGVPLPNGAWTRGVKAKCKACNEYPEFTKLNVLQRELECCECGGALHKIRNLRAQIASAELYVRVMDRAKDHKLII